MLCRWFPVGKLTAQQALQFFHEGFLQCVWPNTQEIFNGTLPFLLIEGLRKVNVFKKATMNDKEKIVEEYSSQCFSTQALSL